MVLVTGDRELKERARARVGIHILTPTRRYGIMVLGQRNDLEWSNTMNTPTKEQAKILFDTLSLKKGDEGYGKGEAHEQIVAKYTTRSSSSYTSQLTGDKRRGISNAIGMLKGEFKKLADGESLEAVENPGKKSRKKKNYPSFPTIAAAKEAGHTGDDKPFILDNGDQPTPTGRTYKQGQPIVNITCGDGTERAAHLQDLHQIKDKTTGEYRSVAMIKAGRRKSKPAKTEETPAQA